jgi:crotonobetainyl-CoA:carnitine CoA-transferase CaiB-like acyl-CoA transferase
MRRVKPPARFGGDRLAPACDSPEHGANTHEVLLELGYGIEDIASMIADKVARPAD